MYIDNNNSDNNGRTLLFIYHHQSIFTLSVTWLTLCEMMATLGMAKLKYFKLIGQGDTEAFVDG